MDKELTVQIKSIYGEDKVYPICKDSRTFANIAGTKTLTQETIAYIKKLGYLFIIEPITKPFL